MDKEKEELNKQLDGVAMYMHANDVDIVRQKIADAAPGQLDAIGLGLRFHRFRVDKAKEEGLIVEV